MNNKIIFLVFLLLTIPIFTVNAEENDDIQVFGLELEKLLNFISGILSTVLFLFAGIAYKRTRRTRLRYVSAAFLLFAIKSFLISSEMFFGDFSLIDPVASLLDFGILLSFFVGIFRE